MWPVFDIHDRTDFSASQGIRVYAIFMTASKHPHPYYYSQHGLAYRLALNSSLDIFPLNLTVQASQRGLLAMRLSHKKKKKMDSKAPDGNAEFSFASNTPRSTGRKGLPKIQTQDHNKKASDHPTTPIKGSQGAFNAIPEEERQKQQVQSISASLASLMRETGPKLVKGDPSRKGEGQQISHHHHYTPTISISDSALKLTHYLYNLSPAELYEQAIKTEKGSFIASSGALATLSGAKTGRSPRDKRVVRDETTEDDLWWGKGSPNIEMDEHTFMVNRERAVDYLNSLDK
ncbi:hypothetical protein OIU78_012102, partial [Salix suchowensis]